MSRMIRSVVAVAAVFCVAGAALAQTSNSLTPRWTHPTERVDDTPLPLSEIRETLVLYGLCVSGGLPAEPSKVVVPAPATTVTIAGVGYGTWCLAAKTVDTGGLESDLSTIESRIILAPPKPPTLLTVQAVAYEWLGDRVGQRVGSIPIGVECPGFTVRGRNKATWHVLPYADVKLRKQPKSRFVVGKCALT